MKKSLFMIIFVLDCIGISALIWKYMPVGLAIACIVVEKLLTTLAAVIHLSELPTTE